MYQKNEKGFFFFLIATKIVSLATFLEMKVAKRQLKKEKKQLGALSLVNVLPSNSIKTVAVPFISLALSDKLEGSSGN